MLSETSVDSAGSGTYSKRQTVQISNMTFAVETFDSDERTDIIRDVIKTGCDTYGSDSIGFRHKDIAQTLTEGGYPTDRRRVSQILNHLIESGEVGAKRIGNKWAYWLKNMVVQAVGEQGFAHMRGGRATAVAAISAAPPAAPARTRSRRAQSAPPSDDFMQGTMFGGAVGTELPPEPEVPEIAREPERSLERDETPRVAHQEWRCPDHPNSKLYYSEKNEHYFCSFPVKKVGNKVEEWCQRNSDNSPTTHGNGGPVAAPRPAEPGPRAQATSNVKPELLAKYPTAYDPNTGELVRPELYGIHETYINLMTKNGGLDPDMVRLIPQMREWLRPYLAADGLYKYPLHDPAP